MAVTVKVIEVFEEEGGGLVAIHVTGKLTAEDYNLFVPQMGNLIKEHGKIRVFLELVDFHGWSAGALWEDTKFAVKHFNDIERLAIVGDKRWEEGMAIFCKPFTTAKVRYFDITENTEAQQWIRE